MVIYYRLKDKILNLFKNKVLGKKYLGTRLSQPVWESQFSSGYWDHLYNQDEQEHYQEICSLYNSYSSGKSILDVGCGQGVLYHYLKEYSEIGQEYFGIDISSAAIEIAKQKFVGINFIQLDFDRKQLTGKFDVIIFNETLYYFDKPIEKIEECRRLNLAVGGCFIISMCEYDGHEEIWKKLEEKYSFIKLRLIQNKNGQKWQVCILS